MSAGKYVQFGYATIFGCGTMVFFGSPFIKDRSLKVIHSKLDPKSFYFLEISKERQNHMDNMMNWYGLDLRNIDKKLVLKGVELYNNKEITKEQLMSEYTQHLEINEESLDQYRTNEDKSIVSKFMDGLAWMFYKNIQMRKYKFYEEYDKDRFVLRSKMSKLVLETMIQEGSLESYALGVNARENEVTGVISGKIGLKFSNGNVWHGDCSEGYLKDGLYDWTSKDMQYDGGEGICSWKDDVSAQDIDYWKKVLPKTTGLENVSSQQF